MRRFAQLRDDQRIAEVKNNLTSETHCQCIFWNFYVLYFNWTDYCTLNGGVEHLRNHVSLWQAMKYVVTLTCVSLRIIWIVRES